jgi:hypothetical protein
MKIVGALLLVWGLFAAFRAFTVPDRNVGTRSEAYEQGRKIGKVGAPVVLIGLGLGLLLRRTGESAPHARTRPVAGGFPPRPTSPPPPIVPAKMPVKIHCGCGQNYSFEVEPVGGRMPGPVSCPACGADGTEAANVTIAQILAARVPPPAFPQTAAPAKRKLSPILIGGIAIAAFIVCFVVASFLVQFSMRNRASRARQGPPPGMRTQPEATRPRAVEPISPGPRRAVGNLPPASKAGTARDAAPVPANMTEVDVFWGSRWYPATILKREGQRAFIHYDGWGSNFDEWVTPERMRPRR